jgi:hypothetical protein
VLLISPRVRTPVSGEADPVVGGPLEGSLQVEQPTQAAQGEVASLGLLFDEVHGYTRTHPSVEDAMYQPFGALAAWVRPPDSTALDAEPFQSALAAFHVPKSQ